MRFLRHELEKWTESGFSGSRAQGLLLKRMRMIDVRCIVVVTNQVGVSSLNMIDPVDRLFSLGG